MVKPVSGIQSRYFSIMLFIVLAFSGFQPAPPAIVLHNERLTLTPKEFYIADVKDEREDRTAVAKILPYLTNNSKKAETFPVDFQSGGFFAMRQFIMHCIPRNNGLRPIVIRIKKFMAIESPSGGARAEGNIQLVTAFDLKTGDEESDHLAEYHGVARYNRNAGPAQDIEPIMRGVLEAGLTYLNSWMDIQVDSNIKLAKEVKLFFSDYSEKNEGDTIYYSAKRPLAWVDFKAPVQNRKFAAEIFPGFGYNEHVSVAKSIIKLGLTIKVYLPKSASWVKDDAKTTYTLNHEQRHFDIVKIIAEHFKRKLLMENLSVKNFEGPVNVEYLESYREMNSLQKQYDTETNHGIDQTAQQRWNGRIDDELKQLGIK